MAEVYKTRIVSMRSAQAREIGLAKELVSVVFFKFLGLADQGAYNNYRLLEQTETAGRPLATPIISFKGRS